MRARLERIEGMIYKGFALLGSIFIYVFSSLSLSFCVVEIDRIKSTITPIQTRFILPRPKFYNPVVTYGTLAPSSPTLFLVSYFSDSLLIPIPDGHLSSGFCDPGIIRSPLLRPQELPNILPSRNRRGTRSDVGYKAVIGSNTRRRAINIRQCITPPCRCAQYCVYVCVCVCIYEYVPASLWVEESFASKTLRKSTLRKRVTLVRSRFFSSLARGAREEEKKKLRRRNLFASGE